MTFHSAEQVQLELDRLINAPKLRRSHLAKRFLQYVVLETLEGRGDRIKAYNIAVEALNKPQDFDPRRDTSVRVLASRLRASLAEHYRTDTQAELRIELPVGSYTPNFVAQTAAAPQAVPEQPKRIIKDPLTGRRTLIY